MQTQRCSMEAGSEASYCDREPWEEDWGSSSALSHILEAATLGSDRPADEVLSERDALVRALAAERQRAAAAARAHDARLAELHGVIAELVRRRATDKQTRAIPEEEISDECESTTQPAGELEHDGDQSRTEQNDSTSLMSPDAEQSLAVDHEPEQSDPTDLAAPQHNRAEHPTSENISKPQQSELSLNLEKDSQLCLNTARCCQSARLATSLDSCSREHGSADGGRLYPASPGRSSSRQAKVASRVRLKRTEDGNGELVNGEWWCLGAAEKLALDISAQADYREALVSAAHDDAANGSVNVNVNASALRVRCARLQADCRVLQCALQRATDTAHRLSVSCAVQESSCVTLCCALGAADTALEVYDVLLALAETRGDTGHQRLAAERVANQVLSRLAAGPDIGRPLLSPGPWMEHDAQSDPAVEWSEDREAALRAHAARLKADTVALRALRPPPKLFSYHDSEDSDSCPGSGMVEMETAVSLQEALVLKEARSARATTDHGSEFVSGSGRSGGRREAHWLDAASETDL